MNKRYSLILLCLICLTGIMMIQQAFSYKTFYKELSSQDFNKSSFSYNSTKIFEVANGSYNIFGVISSNISIYVQYNVNFTYSFSFYNSSYQQYNTANSSTRTNYVLFNQSRAYASEILISADFNTQSDDVFFYLSIIATSGTFDYYFLNKVTFIFNAEAEFDLMSVIASSIFSIILSLTPLLFVSEDLHKYRHIVSIISLFVFAFTNSLYYIVAVIYIMFIFTRSEANEK